MKKYYYLIICSFFFFSTNYAQSKFPPVSVEYGTFLGETIPLSDFETITPTEGVPKNLREIPNNMRNAPKINSNALPQGDDPLAQTIPAFRAPQDILVNFDGAHVSEGQAVPPDPSGAAGPNHYVHAVNLVVKIFDKTGNLLVGPVLLGDFLGSGNNNGDPIVMYDQLADRWFVSQFRISDDALIIGVSTTPDPTGTYNVYQMPLDAFPDYPHYSVWPDAYYLTANKFTGNTTYALDRDVMIAGGANPAIIGFNLPGVIRNPGTVFSPEPANLLGTTFPTDVPGYIIYLQDDSWPSVSNDHLKIWEIDVDFLVPGNSTISTPTEIPVTPFDSTFNPFGIGDVQQPSTSQKIDNLGGVISYMANYRSFGDHNSFLINFNVDLGSIISGIRWIELRNVGNGPFSVYQEGTWTLNDGENRFMGSMAMDINGNIALAYNVGSSETYVGIRFTGRLDGDPLGQMSFQEQVIKDGTSFQNSTNRFGDYAQMTMDPDGETFWHTAEYIKTLNSWQTRIAAFNLEDLPILDLGDDIENNISLEVYPIDSSNYEIILSNPNINSDVSYQVIDIQGKVITTGTLLESGNEYKAAFSKENLAKGIYMIKVYNSSFQEVKKVMIK